MNYTKKITAVILTAVMLVSACSISSFAKPKNEQVPSIIVPGIFQSEVYCYENGEVACNEDGVPLEKPFFLDSTKSIISYAVPRIIYPLLRLLITQTDKDGMCAEALAEALCNVLMNKQLCDENGHFINDIRAAKYNASFDKLSKYDQRYILDNLPLERYIEKGGAENLYVFSYASLGNMIDTAAELYDFIQFVKKDSGSDKVNIVPISQGGSISVALMQLYADRGISLAEDINRMVYVVPALNGSILVGEIYEKGLIDDNIEIYSKMIPSLSDENDWTSYLINIALRIIPNAELNNILDKIVDTLAGDYLGYSTLIWGLVPCENYPAACEKYLCDDAHAKIKEQTDWFYNAQLNRYNNILNAIDDGVEVFDIVAYNYDLYELVDSYDDVNADGIIHLASESMGAYSVGVDKKLPADYKSEHNNCSDPEHHNHTDPNGIVDACCGLLPETTFYFYRQNHEETGCNNKIMYLVAEILTNPELENVFSYPDKYPQFNDARNSEKLMDNIPVMKAYDTSTLSEKDKAELKAVIKEAENAIENTSMSAEEYDKIEARFFEVTNRIINGEQPSEDNTFNFEAFLAKIFKCASDILFTLFDGKGFSEFGK